MFWKFDLHTSSHLEALLDKEDVTLFELMEEEDVLQECKAQNRRLLLFVCQDHCMQELVRMITTEPPAGVEELKRFKYPNIACELLTCDVGMINDKLGNEEALLETLYAFLEQPSPLNPLLASFFSKTIGNLIARKTEQVISFLRRKEEFLSLVLKHIDTSAMMDVLLRLISCVEPPPLRFETLTWLNEQKLAQRLIELIHPERDEERQSNASQTLCDIIRLSRDQANQLQEISQPDPLLTVLESQECVEQLLQNMFSGERTESCIVSGIQVLLTLLEIRRPVVDGVMDAQGFERSYTVNSSILLAIQPHLIHFHQLLLEPPKRDPMLTTLGVLEEPLGNTRLHVARLVASLLYTSSASHTVVAQELCRLNAMDLLLDLFFKYTWNNFLHLQVELCVAAIIRPCAHEMKLQPSFGSNEKIKSQQEASIEPDSTETQTSDPTVTTENSVHNLMVTHLFQHCHLVQRILEAWEENDKIQSAGGMRRGYMGHLTRIANTVVHNLDKGPVHAQISSLITELPEDYRGRWETFVDQTLSETNRKNTIDLAGTGNPRPSSEDDMESPFPKELTIQQAFSDYQIQQMTANFVDQFGFNDEEFTDHDDSIGATFDRIAEININIDAGQDSANTAVFEACSKERIQPFDDDEEDIWEEKEINYAIQTKSRNRFGGSRSSQSQAAIKTCDTTAASGTEIPDAAGDSESEEEEDPKDDLDPFSSLDHSEAAKNTGWVADFGEVNSKAPAAGGGFSAWDTPVTQPAATAEDEEKGWAKFTDFQPFCCSETGPRCSSPVDSELSGSDSTKPNQNPCVWSVCVARKAPLVASDSSSSSSSDSDEEEGKTESTSSETVTTETITTGAGKETIRLTVDAKNERAVFSSEADNVPAEGPSMKDKGKGNDKEGEKEKKREKCSSANTASPTKESAAVTQDVQSSSNGPA
ncbi:serine/threonine-protein phosphatase 6 regulatory subunit 2 isoform X2 [Parambassis ranga]|uniref:Serine/threonine-protein phosphatase 6 regulatory subunit 2 isoform X2 n=1 Tax=Parambassis ranga TaxID=210632 RepID=A0A6P7KEH2_9TELE|nr:serine/threonine-protein phosphatase 6 regulatory subunit 2 isoform X2 [Parambassis ranga]